MRQAIYSRWVDNIADNVKCLISTARQHRRHEAYCRRNQSRIRTRPRSCRACNQAKIKCNFRAPCNQCTRKEIDCVYEQPRKELTASDAPIAVSNHGSNSNNDFLESAPISNVLEVLDGELAGFDRSRHVLGDYVENFLPTLATDYELDGFRIHKDLSTIGGTSMPATLSSEMDNIMSVSQPDSFDLSSSISIGKGLNYIPVHPPTYSSTSGTEVTPTTIHFSKKQIVTPAQQLFTSMLIDMIRAYPLMMTRRETFPPFVHPHCYLYEGCNTFPQALTNCMGIAQLFVSRTNDTRPFLWTTIVAEIRDILSKVPILNSIKSKWLVLILSVTARFNEQI